MSIESSQIINIIIADDHPLVRSGLRNVLEEEPDFKVVGEAADAANLLKCLRGSDANVVITDLAMPGCDGADLIARLKKERPSLPVIVLSLHPEERFATHAMAAGASCYLTKDKSPEILINAIRQVANGQNYVTASAAAELRAEPRNGDLARPGAIPKKRLR